MFVDITSGRKTLRTALIPLMTDPTAQGQFCNAILCVRIETFRNGIVPTTTRAAHCPMVFLALRNRTIPVDGRIREHANACEML